MAYEARGRTGTNTAPFARSGAAAYGGARVGASARAMLGFPIFVGAVHWLIVQLAASLAFRYGTPRESSPPWKNCLGEPQPLTGLAHVVVEPLRMWDGLWYKRIADFGYNAERPLPEFENQCSAGFGIAKAAFWPLYPWLMRLGSDLTGWSTDVVGYIVANLSFVVALIFLYRLVAHDFDRAVARRTLWAIALFPTSLFFSALYTESLFLMLAVGGLLGARLGNWWMAGLLGALAALTRSYGVLLVIPYAVLFLQQYRFDLRRWLPNAIPAALPVLGPAIFAFHLRRIWDDALAFVHVQEQWFRFTATPWETFRCALRGCAVQLDVWNPVQPYQVRGVDTGWVNDLAQSPTWTTFTSNVFRSRFAQSETLELICTVLFLILAVYGLRALPLYQSAFLIPGLVIPLFGPSAVHPLMSMPRFGLTLFPIFVMLALLFKERRFAVPAAIISAGLLVLFTAQFAQWYWVS